MRTLALTLAFLTLSQLALADDVATAKISDAPRVKAKDVIDREAAVTVMVLDEAMRAEPVAAALERCTVDARMLGWIAFDRGKVAQVVVGGGNRAQEPCVIAALRKATFASKGRVVATLEIDTGVAALLKKLDKIELGKFAIVKGSGGGVGLGAGSGTGGGGTAQGDFASKGSISLDRTMTDRKRVTEAKVAIGDAAGELGGLTADEISRVVKSRAGIFRACYQKELHRSPELAGKVIVTFVIGEDGTVRSATIARGSTLQSEAVRQCIKSNAMRLEFPPKGARATVTYPFIFSQA